MNRHKLTAITLTGVLVLSFAAGSTSVSGAAEEARVTKRYEDADFAGIRNMTEVEAEAYIEGFFSRETINEIYGNPYEWEEEYLEEESSESGIYGLFEMLDGVAEEAVFVGKSSGMNTMEAAVDSANYADPGFNTEEYNYYPENGFHTVLTDPFSTFAADADTGSYGNLRRYITNGTPLDQLPMGLLRYEEMLNYFDYTVENRSNGKFSVEMSSGECPWEKSHDLLMLTVQANEVEIENKGNNFVFLLDVSGSMDYDDRILLACKSFAHLARTLTEQDRVSVVTYSGSEDTLLEGCSGANIGEIFEAIRQAEYNCMSYGGGTNGSGGIEAAYECAVKNFIEGGNNRVIIASDGDMNLGITSEAGLVDLIKEKKETGVFLTTLGYGEGNYSDANMERIADCGNGNYFYIDSVKEAIHVLVDKMKQTTVTVAKDVKFQLEFNPNNVAAYKLIGYENRELATEDFANDKKDGGEVGAGAQVTVLYELIPAEETASDETEQNMTTSTMKYQTERALTEQAYSEELATLAIRYKEPDGEESALEEYPVTAKDGGQEFAFTAGLIEACLVINNSEQKGTADLTHAIEVMKENIPEKDELRAGCIEMLEKL